MTSSRVDSHAQLVKATLAGQPAAARELVDLLLPIIQARCARLLLRSRASARGRDVRQEVEDLTQEVFAALFADGGKLLRKWDPEAGLSLQNWVGLAATHRITSILRSRNRNPWTEDPSSDRGFETMLGADTSPHRSLESSEVLRVLLRALRESVSPTGFRMFRLLFVEQREVAEICASEGMTRDAVYAWRSRLRRVVRDLAEQSDATL